MIEESGADMRQKRRWLDGNEQSDPGESGQDLLMCGKWRTARVESTPESPEERSCL